MGTDSGECLAALERRLFKTWRMRGRSAITRGRSGERSMMILCLPPPVRNVFLAWSTRPANTAGSGATDSAPVSIRPTTSRLLIRLLM